MHCGHLYIWEPGRDQPQKYSDWYDGPACGAVKHANPEQPLSLWTDDCSDILGLPRATLAWGSAGGLVEYRAKGDPIR